MVKVTSEAADFGIVVRNEALMLAFYRDVMALPYKGEMKVPGGALHQFSLGSSILKLMVPPAAPEAGPAPGDIQDSTGLRYWTIWVEDLDEAVGSCVAGGATEVRPIVDVGRGLRYAVIADPEGNMAEFIEQRPRS
jgi:predicted enzyme related to lactoylglutathione lyase